LTPSNARYYSPDVRSEALKGHLDSLVLAVVSEGPLHGYAIIERLRLRSDGEFDLPEGTVYPALHRLERLGLFSSSWVTFRGRRRRVYSLTRRGRAELRERRGEWTSFSRAVEAVLA
jgi:DNA-binding PadR family transcriptional regulator